jgi:hypothetical protein
MATPADMDSIKYFCVVLLAQCRNVIPRCDVASANTGSPGTDPALTSRAIGGPEIARKKERRFRVPFYYFYDGASP